MKEVDVDEAKVLLALGLTVGHDWKYLTPSAGFHTEWCSEHPFQYTAEEVDLEYASAPNFKQVFYVALGSED